MRNKQAGQVQAWPHEPVTKGRMMVKNIGDLILRGKKIRVDDEGFVSLNDIHKASGFSTNRRPIDWHRLPTTGPLIIATHERIVGKSHQSKFRTSDVYRAKSGAAGGTWAHPILAASYAGYLKPELEVEAAELLKRQSEWLYLPTLQRQTSQN